jgi:hypothetical protein
MDRIDFKYEGLSDGDFEFGESSGKTIVVVGVLGFVFLLFQLIGALFKKRNLEIGMQDAHVVKIQSMARGFLARKKKKQEEVAAKKIVAWFENRHFEIKKNRERIEFKRKLLNDIRTYSSLSNQLSASLGREDFCHLRPRALSEMMKMECPKEAIALFSKKEIELTESPFKRRQIQMARERLNAMRQSILARSPGFDFSKLSTYSDKLNTEIVSLQSPKEMHLNHLMMQRVFSFEPNFLETTQKKMPVAPLDLVTSKKTLFDHVIEVLSIQIDPNVGRIFSSLISLEGPDVVSEFEYDEKSSEMKIQLRKKIKVFVPKEGQDRTKEGSTLIFGPYVHIKLDRDKRKVQFNEGFKLECEVKVGFFWMQVSPIFYDMTYVSEDHVELRAGMLGQSETKIRSAARLISSWGDVAQIRA